MGIKKKDQTRKWGPTKNISFAQPPQTRINPIDLFVDPLIQKINTLDLFSLPLAGQIKASHPADQAPLAEAAGPLGGPPDGWGAGAARGGAAGAGRPGAAPRSRRPGIARPPGRQSRRAARKPKLRSPGNTEPPGPRGAEGHPPAWGSPALMGVLCHGMPSGGLLSILGARRRHALIEACLQLASQLDTCFGYQVP